MLSISLIYLFLISCNCDFAIFASSSAFFLFHRLSPNTGNFCIKIISDSLWKSVPKSAFMLQNLLQIRKFFGYITIDFFSDFVLIFQIRILSLKIFHFSRISFIFLQRFSRCLFKGPLIENLRAWPNKKHRFKSGEFGRIHVNSVPNPFESNSLTRWALLSSFPEVSSVIFNLNLSLANFRTCSASCFVSSFIFANSFSFFEISLPPSLITSSTNWFRPLRSSGSLTWWGLV